MASKKIATALTDAAQLVGAPSRASEDLGFNSRSENIPRLQVQSPVGAWTEGNRSMFLSQINVPPWLRFII